MDDVLALDGTGQARLVAGGEITARELVEASIRRIEELDGAVNAVVHRRFDRALDEARALDTRLPPRRPDTERPGEPAGRSGPFHGVPFLLKDLFADSAGDPAHHGSMVLKAAGHTARHDCYLVERYRRAGFVVVGRTNTPELGLVPVTEPEAYGPTRNPWDLERSPGGSSGGSAAAVAAGMTAMAHGSDGGGSIRIPASMCGLVGLKVSRGRMSLGPDRDESGLSVQNVLARSVRDVAAVLDATAGPAPGDMVVAPPPTRPYRDELADRPTGLRVGLLAHTPNGVLHPDCEQAVRHTASLLESLGHHVEEAYPAALDDPENGRRFLARWAVNIRLGVLAMGELVGRELGPDDVEPLTWAFSEAASAYSATDYALAVAASARLTREIGRWFGEGFDVLLTPTLGEPPPRVGELMPPAEAPFSTQGRIAALVPFTTHFNVTGQPALSLPLFWNDEGLPIGSQLVAGYGREDLLIRLAAQLEEAAPWADRRPPRQARRRPPRQDRPHPPRRVPRRPGGTA